jgi:hypothetical protein
MGATCAFPKSLCYVTSKLYLQVNYIIIISQFLLILLNNLLVNLIGEIVLQNNFVAA